MKTTTNRQKWAGALAACALMVGVVGVAFAEGGGAEPRRISGDGVEQLAAKLNARERAIDRRETSLQDREADLRAAEDRLEARLGELQELRASIDLQLEGLAEDDERRRAALVVMVEKMKGKDAAPMVGKLDQELAVDVLDRMNPAKAAKVLAAMPPGQSAALASRLAAPTEIQ